MAIRDQKVKLWIRPDFTRPADVENYLRQLTPDGKGLDERIGVAVGPVMAMAQDGGVIKVLRTARPTLPILGLPWTGEDLEEAMLVLSSHLGFKCSIVFSHPLPDAVMSKLAKLPRWGEVPAYQQLRACATSLEENRAIWLAREFIKTYAGDGLIVPKSLVTEIRRYSEAYMIMPVHSLANLGYVHHAAANAILVSSRLLGGVPKQELQLSPREAVQQLLDTFP
jgi:hypothetical protein